MPALCWDVDDDDTDEADSDTCDCAAETYEMAVGRTNEEVVEAAVTVLLGKEGKISAEWIETGEKAAMGDRPSRCSVRSCLALRFSSFASVICTS
jgi:hypothetical protein